MSTKKKTSRRTKAPEPSFRHVWLAGLGVVAIARRESAARLDAAKQGIERIAQQAQANVREGLASVREQGEARVGQFSAELEARLAPVLNKLGLSSGRAVPVRRRKAAKATKAAPAAARKRPAAKPPARKRRA